MHIYHEPTQPGHKPIKTWTRGVQLEEEAWSQLQNLASMPFVHKHIAAMPDVHWGKGATVGSVIATRGAIIPAAVGVDIGCGMTAQKLTLKASDLPDHLGEARSAIESAVPHGRNAGGGRGDRGAWGNPPKESQDAWKALAEGYESILDGHGKARSKNAAVHMGTLGTGNHFIEICLDENDQVWIMLHSGSRGPGNSIGRHFIQKAKKEMERWFIQLPDKDLAYFPQGNPLFKDYVQAVNWAQSYAHANRQVMLSAILQALGDVLPPFKTDGQLTDCHHNYVAFENHFGENAIVTRKGAVRAREGDWGIIPGSMGARSYIVRGKGNPESFHSCSHGAGRAMSRKAAKERFTLEDHVKATKGVECRKDIGVLDETPQAYKPIDAVMAAQEDLIEIMHTLRQIICVKG